MSPILNRILAILIIGPVGILGILAALQILLKSPFWHDDTASAIGTFGTFVAAIWIAVQGERQRRREAHDRAIIAAAAIAPRLLDVYQRLVHIDRFVTSRAFETASMIALEANLSAMRDAVLWSDDEVLPLVVLPHRIAARLITLRIKIAIVKTVYDGHADNAKSYPGLREHGITPDDQHAPLVPLCMQLSAINHQLGKLIEEVYDPIPLPTSFRYPYL